jgi:hypothetical protein
VLMSSPKSSGSSATSSPNKQTTRGCHGSDWVAPFTAVSWKSPTQGTVTAWQWTRAARYPFRSSNRINTFLFIVNGEEWAQKVSSFDWDLVDFGQCPRFLQRGNSFLKEKAAAYGRTKHGLQFISRSGQYLWRRDTSVDTTLYYHNRRLNFLFASMSEVPPAIQKLIRRLITSFPPEPSPWKRPNRA